MFATITSIGTEPPITPFASGGAKLICAVLAAVSVSVLIHNMRETATIEAAIFTRPL